MSPGAIDELHHEEDNVTSDMAVLVAAAASIDCLLYTSDAADE